MPIFYSDDDRRSLLAILGSVVKKHNCMVHAYCLMDNHYHLLIETIEANLSRVMHNLNGTYCQSFNRRHQRVGHLFQGRYRSTVIDREEYLLVAARYIVLNPVRAGIAREPSSYPWSSYADVAGLRTPSAFLTIQDILSLFSENEALAQKLYREFVFQGIGQEIHCELPSVAFLGGEEFLDHVRVLFEGKKTIKEIPRKQRLFNRPCLDDILKQHSSLKERNEGIYLAFMDFGYKQKEIADFLGLAYSTLSEIIKEEERGRNG